MLLIINFIKKNLLIILSTTLLLPLVGCKDFNNHTSDETPLVKVRFKTTTQQDDGSTQVQDAKDSFDSIQGEGLPQALLATPQYTGIVKLPLNPNSDTTTFRFYKEGRLIGTLTFRYKSTIFLISPQWGASQYYVLTYIKTTFSSSMILNPNLKRRTEEPNVDIFV